MILLNIPIEPLPERYSMQWDKWFQKEFGEANLNVCNVYGENTSGKIGNGSFLDVTETNLYKTSQLREIILFIANCDKNEKIVLFFHDIWNPAIPTIAYIRDGLGLKNLKICGCLHAGSYDEYDFLNKQGMTPWACYLEQSIGAIVDKIFVATRFHKNMFCTRRNIDKNKVVVTGFPIYDDFIKDMPETEKKQIIVFPHRLDSEKRPDLFDVLSKDPLFADYTFIKSKEKAKSKRAYYRLLQQSYIAVSFAEQETWGIAMQEAVICGCIPICPQRLSYKEMYSQAFLYNSMAECKHLIETYIKKFPLAPLHVQRSTILQDGKHAIPLIIKEILAL